MAALRQLVNLSATSNDDISLATDDELFDVLLRKVFRMQGERNWLSTREAMEYLVKEGKAFRPVNTLYGVRRLIKKAAEKGFIVRSRNIGSGSKNIYMWHKDDIIELQRRRREGL